MSKFQKVRGMHDVPLDQSSVWSEVIEKITHTLKSYSYSEIRLPIIENTDLFKRSVGDLSLIHISEPTRPY